MMDKAQGTEIVWQKGVFIDNEGQIGVHVEGIGNLSPEDFISRTRHQAIEEVLSRLEGVGDRMRNKYHDVKYHNDAEKVVVDLFKEIEAIGKDLLT